MTIIVTKRNRDTLPNLFGLYVSNTILLIREFITELKLFDTLGVPSLRQVKTKHQCRDWKL